MTHERLLALPYIANDVIRRQDVLVIWNQWRQTLPHDAPFRHSDGVRFMEFLNDLPVAAVPRIAPPAEWQPIETAPKDGTWILAFEPGLSIRTVQRDSGVWFDGTNDFTPSRWMPLPDPPDSAGTLPRKENVSHAANAPVSLSQPSECESRSTDGDVQAMIGVSVTEQRPVSELAPAAPPNSPRPADDAQPASGSSDSRSRNHSALMAAGQTEPGSEPGDSHQASPAEGRALSPQLLTCEEAYENGGSCRTHYDDQPDVWCYACAFNELMKLRAAPPALAEAPVHQLIHVIRGLLRFAQLALGELDFSAVAPGEFDACARAIHDAEAALLAHGRQG